MTRSNSALTSEQTIPEIVGCEIVGTSDGKTLVSYSYRNGDSTIRVFDTYGKLLKTLDLQTSAKLLNATVNKDFIAIESVRFSADNLKLIVQLVNENEKKYWIDLPSRFAEVDLESGRVLRISRSTENRAVLLTPDSGSNSSSRPKPKTCKALFKG